MSDVTGEYQRAMRRRGLAAGTVSTRVAELRRWLVWCGDRWPVATRQDVERWLDGRPLGLRARYTAISHLSAFYRWAIREGLADRDPTVSVERPRLPMRLPRPVRGEHVDRLLVELGDGPVRLAVLLMLDAGLRCCEVARLRWVDVDLEAGTLYVSGKGARERLVGVPNRLRIALYQADFVCDDIRVGVQVRTDPVIGRHWTAARVSQAVNGELRRVGVDATAHRLRHTYATRLYAATSGDLRAVQLSLGHASVATTQIYAAVDVARVVQAARLLD